MISKKIFNYCKKNNFNILKVFNRKKSLILWLNKGRKKYILKKPFVSKSDDVFKSFKKELNTYRQVETFSNNCVKVPLIVDINEDECFFIFEMVIGKSINSFLKNPFNKQQDIMSIHEKLFNWVNHYYCNNCITDRSLNVSAILENGVFSKKILNNQNDHERINKFIKLLELENPMISNIHGDLTPWNIILDKKGQLFIIDWGNSGIDYSGLDIARYLIQVIKILQLFGNTDYFLNLYWDCFKSIYNNNKSLFSYMINIQDSYSEVIYKKNAESSKNIYYRMKLNLMNRLLEKSTKSIITYANKGQK